MAQIGQFIRLPDDSEISYQWARGIKDEGTFVYLAQDKDKIRLTIRPTITAVEHHHPRRIAGSVMFEMAWRIAQRVDGTIYQLANIAGCKPEDGSTKVLLGAFPEQPFDFNSICPGFQAAWLDHGLLA